MQTKMGPNMKLRIIMLIILFLPSLIFPNPGIAGPLHGAVLANNLEKIERLLKKGEKINELNEDGNWPLLLAATYGYADVCKLLIKKGADVNQANQHGYTALHEAASMGYIKVVKILVQNHADVNKVDINNYNALKYALISGTPMVVRYLKRHGAKE
jgi:ankyrin repeat protein